MAVTDLANSLTKSLWAGCAHELPGRHSNLRAVFVPSGLSRDPFATMLLPVRNLSAQNRFEEAVGVIERFRFNDMFGWTGRPLSSFAAQALTDDMVAERGHEAHNTARVEQLRAWHMRAPDCAFAAAALADGLARTAQGYRGRGTPGELTRDQWAGFGDHRAEAREVLEWAKKAHAGHWYWSQVYLRTVRVTGESAEERLSRFDAAFAASPHDPTNYESLVRALLPRASGPCGALDAQAVRVAEETSDHFGQAAYSMIYQCVAKFETLSRTGLDWDRLHRGFADWHTAFPSDRVRTAHASAAFELRQMGAFRDVAEAAARIYEDQWVAAVDFYTANSLARSFANDR